MFLKHTYPFAFTFRWIGQVETCNIMSEENCPIPRSMGEFLC